MDYKNNDEIQLDNKLDKWKKVMDNYYENIKEGDLKKDLEKAGFTIK